MCLPIFQLSLEINRVQLSDEVRFYVAGFRTNINSYIRNLNYNFHLILFSLKYFQRNYSY